MACFLLYTRVELRASVIPISLSSSDDFMNCICKFVGRGRDRGPKISRVFEKIAENYLILHKYEVIIDVNEFV